MKEITKPFKDLSDDEIEELFEAADVEWRQTPLSPEDPLGLHFPVVKIGGEEVAIDPRPWVPPPDYDEYDYGWGFDGIDFT